MTDEQTHLSNSGYVVLATVRAGICGAFTLLSHAGMTVSRVGQAVTLRGDWVTSLVFAWYSRSVAAKNWQPCDQPTPAAYLPVRYDAVDRTEGSSGVLLVQKTPIFENPRTIRAVVDDRQRFCAQFTADQRDEMRRVIASLLARAGASDPAGFGGVVVDRAYSQSIHSAA